jgi:hypothetical protein
MVRAEQRLEAIEAWRTTTVREPGDRASLVCQADHAFPAMKVSGHGTPRACWNQIRSTRSFLPVRLWLE